jgi:hypothetical protein
MNPAFYDEFVTCLKNDEHSSSTLLRLIEPEGSNKQYITVKNYESKSGVSSRFHRAIANSERIDFDQIENDSNYEGFVNQSMKGTRDAEFENENETLVHE